MNSIELMMAEHDLIKRMLNVMRNYCLKLVNHEEVEIEDFYKMLEFVRDFADKHHHGKEEKILFELMTKELGEWVQRGPLMGMLVEHDYGRLYMTNLEDSLKEYRRGNKDAKLDIIANAVGYCELLKRHIDKEDSVIYKLAERDLSDEGKEFLNIECEKVEAAASENNLQDYYTHLVEELEAKVGL